MNEENRQFYKSIGPNGMRQISEEYFVNDDIDFVVQHSGKDEKILDMACGYG